MVVKPEDWLAARKSFDETQAEFAKRIGVSREYVAHLESGRKTSPRQWVLDKLTEVLRTKGTGSTARAAILRRIQEGE